MMNIILAGMLGFNHMVNTEVKEYYPSEYEFQLGMREQIENKLKEYKSKPVIARSVEVEETIIEEEVAEDYEVYPSYNPYNILEASNITREQMYELLEGTPLQNVSRMYVYLEEIYGINAIFIASLSAEESGWGNSSLAMTNNNIGGIKSRDGGWAYFDSWQDCLEYKADLLYDEYLSEDGVYFNGYTIWSINERYCETDSWSENINQIAYGLLNKLN